MDPTRILRSLVELQNECLATKEWERVLVLFHPAAELVFDGILFGPFHGWEEIRGAYREGPPHDRMDLLDVAWGGGRAVATFAWRKRPGQIAGNLVLEGENDLITRLVVTLFEE